MPSSLFPYLSEFHIFITCTVSSVSHDTQSMGVYATNKLKNTNPTCNSATFILTNPVPVYGILKIGPNKSWFIKSYKKFVKQWCGFLHRLVSSFVLWNDLRKFIVLADGVIFTVKLKFLMRNFFHGFFFSNLLLGGATFPQICGSCSGPIVDEALG
jgi:hypothetical protein